MSIMAGCTTATKAGVLQTVKVGFSMAA